MQNSNLVEVIISYDKNGADVIGLQEIENMNILEQLLIFTALWLYRFSIA